MMIGITGATGKLGRLVIDELLRIVPPAQIVAIVRSPEQAGDLAQKGIAVRHGDYDAPETLTDAFAGVDRLLFISSNAVGRREPQHRAVIEAAKAAGLGLVAYTSLLHATTSPLALRQEHVLTEQALAASGVPHVLLRNGWYTENYTGGNYAGTLPRAIESGELIGAAGDGRVSAAARADYAAAAAAVLTADTEQAGRIYELAGDEAFTFADLAAEAARLTGKPVIYRSLPEAEYRAFLSAGGLPDHFAAILAATDIGISQGGLFDDGGQLSRLIGRPTTPWTQTVAEALGRS